MRAFLGCILAVGLAAAPAIAAPGGAGDSSPVPARSAEPAAAKARPSAASAAKAPAKSDVSSIEYEIDELRDALDQQSRQIQSQNEQLKQQQKTIEALEERLNAAKAGKESLTAAGATTSPAFTTSAAPATPSAGLTATTTTAHRQANPLTRLVADMKPGAASGGTVSAAAAAQGAQEQKLSDLAYGKIHIGGTFFGDYAYYARTGFGPQFLTQTNQPGPGNNGFNSFDVNRAYINLFYTPNDAVTLRFTPNIYRQVDGSSGSIGDGTGAQIGGSTNGNLTFRLKYAYIDFNTLFSGSEHFSKDKLTVGSTTNPLIDWEEGLYGYRYVNLVPWNYLSLSSTYVGVTLHGPIMMSGKEYLDYHVGVFNTASFHSIEQNDKKQFMARLTWYPVGTTSDRTGLGITGFVDYGYSTNFPDTRSAPLTRVSTIAFYQTHSKGYEIAGEYDFGHNGLGSGNLFSGAKPDSSGPYADLASLASAAIPGEHTRQQGFAFFGHARLGNSPFTLFGMYQYFQPNTEYVGTNPMDFERVIGGISYKYNEHFEFALDSQNYIWTHNALLSSLVGPDASKDTNAIFLNLLFNY